MIRPDKIKRLRKYNYEAYFKDSLGIWLKVLGMLAKIISHTMCSSYDSKRIFPEHKSQY